MQSKSIKGNSIEEINTALQQSMADAYRPTLAIIFISVRQDRKAICEILHKEGIDIIGATSCGEFINGSQDEGSIVILLLDLSREAYSILFEEIADTAFRSFTNERPYYIIAWDKDMPRNIAVIRKLDERSAIVELNSQSAVESLKQQIRIAAANNQWKFAPGVANAVEKSKNEESTFILTGLYTDRLLEALQNRSGSIKILSVDRPSNSVIIRTTAKIMIDQLLPLKEVIFIDLRAEPRSETGIIGYNRSFHGINAVDYSIPAANGKNIVAGVKEQRMEEADLDIYKRVLPSPIAAAAITNHATVIASIIGGAGNSFYDGRGIAYGCTFFPSSFDNLFADDAAKLFRLRLHKGGELGGRGVVGARADLLEARQDLGLFQEHLQFAIERVDDGGRRARRQEDAEPR